MFKSCRTNAPYTFEEAILSGWADDGGMILPEEIPTLTIDQLKEWKELSYRELMVAFLRLYISTKEVSTCDLQKIVNKAFQVFPEDKIVTLTRVDQVHLCELWHGPTVAFKDLGMQILVQFLQYFLEKRSKKLHLLVGTSGDTGSAAIEAVRHCDTMKLIVLYPKGRISAIQELQMTVAGEEADNIQVFGVEGTSDDLDVPIEAVFSDTAFKKKQCLGSVNSVNICRVLAQSVHYFYAFLQLTQSMDEPVTFCVPTGAGGHVTAGIIARFMALRSVKLLICTNENDILHRLFSTGAFHLAKQVKQTNSPSMDIQVPYNIERLLFLYTDGDTTQVKQWMEGFKATGKLDFSSQVVQDMKQKLGVETVSASIAQVNQCIYHTYKTNQYLLDPHTAVGVSAAHRTSPPHLTICMACAHPSKFQSVLSTALQLSPTETLSAIPNQEHPSVHRTLSLSLHEPKARVLTKDMNWTQELRTAIVETSVV